MSIERVKKKSGNLYKNFSGSYQYLRDGTPFCEESFIVYKDFKELGYHYYAEVLSRIATGELLKINVEYIVNKDWLPVDVSILKVLGKDFCRETYKYNTNSNKLTYTYRRDDDDEKTEICEMTPPNRFHIASPAAVTSTIFIRSKKYDQTVKNTHSFLISRNNWEFKKPPEVTTMVLKRVGQVSEPINLNGQEIQAARYIVQEDIDNEGTTNSGNSGPGASLTFYLSKHVGIPYMLLGDDETTIKITKLRTYSEDL